MSILYKTIKTGIGEVTVIGETGELEISMSVNADKGIYKTHMHFNLSEARKIANALNEAIRTAQAVEVSA